MGGALMRLWRGPPETEIKGYVPRIKNIFINHFRGIIGVLVPIILLSWQLQLKDANKTILHIWIWMACFFFFQPVSIQVTGSIPIFAFPMLGVLPTAQVVKCYFNEGIALFLIGGMLHLLLNNSGFDRRMTLKIICMGSAKWFSPYMLLFKSALAGFVGSIFCHRLIVASTVIQYVTPVLMDLQAATARYRATEPEFNNIRYIINIAIQSSCSIGGLVIVHASYCTLAFRAIFYESGFYPDIFNYLQYTMFALPVAIVMFLVNLIYHAVLIKFTGGKPMTDARMTALRTTMLKYKSEIPPKVTPHEKLTLFFLLFSLIMFFSRYINFLKAGWAKFSVLNGVPKVKDATVAAIFVIFLHILPRSYGFIKVCLAKKKSDLPPTKAESAILFWRFVDKNTNYGYFFVIGAGVALWVASEGAAKTLSAKFSFIANMDFCIAILVIAIISSILSNLISGVAAVSLWLPLVLRLGRYKNETDIWNYSIYRAAMAVGLSSSFGFMSPFLYTPAYFCHHTGKVPKRIMAKFGLIPCILLPVILYLGLCFYAPIIFGEKVASLPDPSIITTPAPSAATEAAEPVGF